MAVHICGNPAITVLIFPVANHYLQSLNSGFIKVNL